MSSTSLLVIASFLGPAILISAQPGTLVWSYDEGSALSGPTLARDGTVYVSTSAAFFAVTNSGSAASNKWSVSVAMQGSAAIAADGTIYLGGQDGNLYAISPDGSQKWSYPAQGAGGSPAIGADSTVYFAGWAALYAVTPSGLKKWSFAVPSGLGFPSASPSIAPDGTIYIGSSYSAQLFAVNPDGTQKWAYNFAHGLCDSSAIGPDGTIYSSSQDLYATSPYGTNLWTTSGGSFDGSPVLGRDGSIYVGGARSHYLSALNPFGQFRWAVLPQSSASISTTPAIDASGTIYYCVSNGVWAVNSQGQIQWTVTAPGDPGVGNYFATTSPVLGPDGTIYVSLGSKIYAITSGAKGPANSTWPMSRQNSRQTGKIEMPSLQSPQKRSDANFQFQLYPQQLGLTYSIETSTNLNTWTSLTSFVATTLPMPVVDLTATNTPAKLYRASSPP